MKPSECQPTGFLQKFYVQLLGLYPREFQRQFSEEMFDVFQQAWSEQITGSPKQRLLFAAREFGGLLTNILVQHYSFFTNNGLTRFTAATLLSFSLIFFILLCMGIHGIPVYANLLLSGLCGCIAGVSACSLYNAILSSRAALIAALGFITLYLSGKAFYANVLLAHYPEATAVAIWIVFIGSLVGIIIAMVTGRSRSWLLFSLMFSFLFIAGILVHRLSAALLQSFVVRGPIQDISTPAGLVLFFYLPLIVQGIFSVGMLSALRIIRPVKH